MSPCRRVLAAVVLAFFAGSLAGWYVPHPEPGTPLPIRWRPDGRPYECLLNAKTGAVEFCLTQAQLDAAASPSPRATP